MNELIKVAERTYYFSGPFQIGVYVLDEAADANGRIPVCLIESGVDMVVASVLDERLEENNFYVRYIINTHYHADHAGGNDYFVKKYNCEIVSSKMNAALISNYDICPAIVWGGSPVKEIMNKYFYATPSEVKDIEEVVLPSGLSYFELPGHSLSMICVRTSDDVLFIGDAVVSKDTLKEHPLTYIYDIGMYCESLDKLKNVKAGLYIPYHAKPVKSIKKLAQLNKLRVLENIEIIENICSKSKSMDEIISEYYGRLDYKLTLYKYAVEASVIKNYVTYLYNEKRLSVIVEDNIIKWKK